MSSSAPIGVFDSGLGGISVARQIAKDMPAEHVLYFGDSANAPYGIKTPEQVRALSFDIVERFVRQGVKAVVIACNTATSAARNNSQYLMNRFGQAIPEQTRQLSMLDLVSPPEQSLFLHDEDE